MKKPVETFVVQIKINVMWVDAHLRQVAGVAFDLADDLTRDGVETRVVRRWL